VIKRNKGRVGEEEAAAHDCGGGAVMLEEGGGRVREARISPEEMRNRRGQF
jgi:hypothetical protein